MYSSFSLRNGFSIQPLFACLFCLEDFFFLMWAIFKVLIQFVTILLLFYFLVF